VLWFDSTQPAFDFLPRLNFAGSESAVTSELKDGGSIPPALRRVAQWLAHSAGRKAVPVDVFLPQ